jgi:hypothetical protein
MTRRVKGRPFREVDPNNHLHRIGNRNTAGSYGEQSVWGVRVSHSKSNAKGIDPAKFGQHAQGVVVVTSLPGKSRSNATLKRPCKLVSAEDIKGWRKQRVTQLLNLRNDMYTAAILGTLPPNATTAMDKVNTMLGDLMTLEEKRAMDKADKSRFYTLEGMKKKGLVGAPITNFWGRFNRLARNANI